MRSIYEPRPCKGLISRILLRGKPRPRYAPPSGAIPRLRAAQQFVNSFNSLLRRLRPTMNCGAAPQPRCKNSINSNLRRERPERAASSQPRATPWVPEYKALRPVRAKVWAHLLFITFALTGRWCGTYVNPGRCPGLRTCWAFSPRRVARMSRTCGASAPERG